MCGMAMTVTPAAALALVLTGTFLFPGSTARAAEPETMTLRINDSSGRPGELVAVVLRTYAPRGVEQGQICLRARSRIKATGQPAPLAVLEEVVVFSQDGDTISVATFDETNQTAQVEFSSASASINLSDGPLAAFFFRLDSQLTGGEEFLVELDSEATFLVASGDENVLIELRSGGLLIQAPGSPFHLAAEGDSVLPGDVALLAVETSESFAVSAGRVTFIYDETFAAQPPEVFMDPRYGSSVLAVDSATPGRVVVSFTSADSSVNRVPGAIVSLLLPTSWALPVGAQSLLRLDPEETWLEDPLGRRIDLELAGDVLLLSGDASIFADGFESGTTSAWSPF